MYNFCLSVFPEKRSRSQLSRLVSYDEQSQMKKPMEKTKRGLVSPLATREFPISIGFASRTLRPKIVQNSIEA